MKNKLITLASSAVLSTAAVADTYTVTLDGNALYQATMSIVTGSPDWIPSSYSDPQPPQLVIGASNGTSWLDLDGFAIPNPAASAPAGPAQQLTLTIDETGTPVDFRRTFTDRFVQATFPIAAIERAAGWAVEMDTRNTSNGNMVCTTDTSVAGTITWDCPLDPTGDDNGYTTDSSSTDAALYPFACGTIDPYTANPVLYWKMGADRVAQPLIQPDPANGIVGDPVEPILDNSGAPATIDLGGGPLTIYKPENWAFDQSCGFDIHRGQESEAIRLVMSHTGVLGDSSFEITGVELYSINQLQVPLGGGNFAPFQSADRATFTTPVSQSNFGGGSKNVPAMGAFGLAALFGGLVAVAMRLRKRVQ